MSPACREDVNTQQSLPASSTALVLAAALLAACTTHGPSPSPTSVIERTCSRADALVASTLHGTTLAANELALTFDDGPGSRSIELSAWLAAEGISATFFVVGENVLSRPAVLAQLVADGHLVANHTQHHLDLTSAAAFPTTTTRRRTGARRRPILACLRRRTTTPRIESVSAGSRVACTRAHRLRRPPLALGAAGHFARKRGASRLAWSLHIRACGLPRIRSRSSRRRARPLR